MSDDEEARRVATLARHGNTHWGKYGSVFDHERYLLPIESRQRCSECPGKGMKRARITHAGMCNGVSLAWGCEWHMRQWVREQDETYGKQSPCPLPINPATL